MPVVSLMSALDVLVLVTSISAFIAIRNNQRRQGVPYPPGPRPLPLIGNLLDIPKEFSWLSYNQLSEKYGMVSLARWKFSDGRDVRRCIIFPCLRKSHRRVKFSQSKQGSPRKAWRRLL